MKRIITIILGILAVLIGLGFIMPTIAQWRSLGSLPGSSVMLLLLGVVLTVCGLGATVRGIRQRRV